MFARRPLHRLAPAALAGALLLSLTAGPAMAAKKPTSTKATSGAYSAKVTYTPGNPKKYTDYKHLRLTVTGPSGTGLTNVKLPHNTSAARRPGLRLVDLNGDGIPDPLVDTFTGGAHCCSIVSLAISGGGTWSAPQTQSFGDYGYELKDVGGTSAPEFVSADDRFAYAYTAYAGSIPPIQIWSATTGKLVDVTRQFPDQIKTDRAALSGYWTDAAKSAVNEMDGDPEGVQAITAAWIADDALLGDTADAKALIDKTTQAGFLKGGPTLNWQNAKTFAGQLSHDMVAWGYLTDPTLYGLPAVS